MSVKLTEEQTAILRSRSFRQGPGHSCAQWIAEECGQSYNTPWASSRLPGLMKRGLVERISPGWYQLTPEARALLAQERTDGR